MEKTIDLAPKAEKLTEDQLKDLQALLSKINQSQLNVGQLETQKQSLLQDVFELQTKLKEMQDKLEADYGKVSINVQDGSISELPEDEADKKD